MAKQALTVGETSLIRGSQWIEDLELYITPLVEIVSGEITAIPNKYPTTSLTVTWGGATTDVVIGQYYRITDDDTVIAHGVIRKAVSGSTCYINETPLGSYGFASNIEAPIAVGMTITIYSHHAMFSLNNRIFNKTFYKYWDLPYSNQNEVEWPVANAGAWQAKKLGIGETTARFTLPKGGVNISWALATPDDVISNVEWFVPAGVSIVAGYDEFDTVIEVDAVAGKHLVKFAVYNSGEEHFAYLWLFVSDGSTGVGLQEFLSVEVSGDNQNELGRSMDVTVYGGNLANTLYEGAGILFQERAKYAGETLDALIGIDTFIGYITELSLSHDGNIGKATFKLVSPMILAQQIGQASQSLTQVANATNWNQCTISYANMRAYTHYLIKWTCPTLLDMHDLDIPTAYEDTLRKYMEVNNKNLQANLQTVADYLLANIGSASDGSSVMRLKPQYMSNANRNLVDTVWTILDTDIKGPLEYLKRFYNPYSDVRGGAFSFATGTTKPKASYAGRRWSQGTGSSDMPNFTVMPTEGESRIKQVLGHYMAEQNATLQELSVDLLRNQDVIDPAYQLWYRVTVDSDYDSLGRGIDSRLLATEITREWEFGEGGIKKRIRLTGRLETFGQEGEILPIGNFKGISNGGWSVGTPQFWIPNYSTGMFSGVQNASVAIALNENGACAISSNYSAPEPSWYSLNFGADNLPISDIDFDYGSDFFANGRDAASALGLWAVTVDGDNVDIWYFPDALRSNGATSVKSYNLPDETITTEARIKSSETYPQLVLAVFKDGTGTRYGRSTNGGGTWTALGQIGTAITDNEDNDGADIGMAVYGQYQFVSAPDGSGSYGVYRAITANGLFSIMTGSQNSPRPHPMIAEAVETNDYIYATQFDVIEYSNDFTVSDDFTFEDCWWPAPPGGFIWARLLDDSCQGDPPPFVSEWNYDGIVSGAVQYSASNTSSQCALAFAWDSGDDLHDFGFNIWFETGDTSERLLINNTGVDDDPILLAGQGQWHRIRGSDFGLVDNYPVTTGQFAPFFSIQGGGTGSCLIRIDDMSLYIGAGFKLWRVTDATGSPSWTNVTPSAGKAPYTPFGLITNLQDNSDLNMVSFLGNTWYSSTNNGTSWSTEDSSSDFRTFYAAGNNLLAGGDDTIQISSDRGATDTSIEGDLDNLWDGLGTIKKLLAL